MVIKSKPQSKNKKIEIDLTGPDGNVFYILGVAKNLCKQLNMDFVIIKEKMTSGNYENLVKVFDEYFGDWAVLYR